MPLRRPERTAAFVQDETEAFARLIASESGKVPRTARKEVGRYVNISRLSAEEARPLGGKIVPVDAFPRSERRAGCFRREPIGGVVAIPPFNAPLNLVAHGLGPAVASGNSVGLEPSELAPPADGAEIRIDPLCRRADIADIATLGMPVDVGQEIGRRHVARDAVQEKRRNRRASPYR